jgi:hypothetical protein
MEEKINYIKHLKESWKFAQETTENELKIKGHTSVNVALEVFKKVCTPYHFFLQGMKQSDEKPTEKQLKYAESLDIENPGQYTKQQLSKKIKEKVDNG